MKTMIVYVDGSYKPSTPNRVGAGVVIVENDEIKEEFMFYRDNEEMASMRQICGELVATMESVRLAVNRGYEKIIINYDYEGIEKWANSQWRTKNKYTQTYKEYMDKMSKQIEIEFNKCDAHTGNVFNEYADYLAKKSLKL